MAGSVTPARRRRSEDDVAGDDDVISMASSEDTLSSGSGNGNKRARLGDGEDDRSETGEGPLLPDSFRRSPRGSQTQANGLGSAVEGRASTHQPGSIVRVSLTNFVTYTNAEFHPGPNLNMIIGPNGTGKSTLVCAICLGLGWATSHLGRAKDLGEFVKHGSKKAEIQIELAADPKHHDENPIVTTKITKDGNKAEYYINDRKSNKKNVQALARSFSIQIDNLCQFLPQDRVVEFAALSPVDLLAHTQRAAAPEYMTGWHDELKEMRKTQKQSEEELRSVVETLKNLESRQRLQEADVVRLRERAQLQARKTALEKMRPFPLYKEAKDNHQEVKRQHKDGARELRRLTARLEPNLRAAKDKQEYLEAVDKVAKQRQNVVHRSEAHVQEQFKKIDESRDKIQECLDEIESEKDQVKTTRASIPRLQQELHRFRVALDAPPPDYDFSAMNEEMRERTRQIREIDAQLAQVDDRAGSLNAQFRQRQQTIDQCRRDISSLDSQEGQQLNKLAKFAPEAAKAWAWIKDNRHRFEGPVFGPPMVECRIKDQRYADAVESMIPQSEMTAFTVTSSADFKILQEQVYGTMRLHRINLRNSSLPLERFEPAVARDQLERLGLESYLLDLIEGPDPVLAMLCDNRNLHQAGYTSRDVSEEQFEAIKRTNISSWVTSKQTYVISRRREYGDQATSTRVTALKPARFFTDVPVDQQLKQDLERKINEAKDEIQECSDAAKELKQEKTTLQDRRKALVSEKKVIEDDKSAKQRAVAEFQGLPVKRDLAQKKLDDAQAVVAAFKDRKREIDLRQDKICLGKGQQAVDLALAVESLRGLHIQLFEAEILRIEAQSDLTQLEAQHAEEQRLLEEKSREVDALQRRKEELRAKAEELSAMCRRIADDELSDDEISLYRDEVVDWTSEQLETEIQSTQARLELTLGGGNENTLREFERRGRSIHEKRASLEELEAQLEELQTKIASVRDRWEPELDALIAKISDAFAENFARIQCAGEVAVHKDDDFEQWAIQIKVKFREHEALSILDSHRQSGGERAVSTIFYLMALQSLARAPFRVVDEINQGMDPRNERMVHSRMVDIACAEHTSQYFLITPKLLQGLKYHPNMKVHCIASGEHMPSDHRELDFGLLAQNALALRAGAP